jgi:hypothetical protein
MLFLLLKLYACIVTIDNSVMMFAMQNIAFEPCLIRD